MTTTTTRREGTSFLPRPVLVGCAIILLGAGLVVTVPDDPSWWKVVVLGVVEGVTEFFPISSTGHLLIASRLLHFEHSVEGTFEIFIQLGAVIAVVGYYAQDLVTQIRTFPTDARVRRLWRAIAIAFLPAAVIGLLLREWIKTVLFAPTVIAVTLIVGGIVLLLIERQPRRSPAPAGVVRVAPGQAVGIGLAQTLALVPGVSRSGAAMVGGLLSGLDRQSATTVAFYLAIPTLGGATVVDLLGSLGELTVDDLGRLYLGLVVSLIVAWLSIGWLLRLVRQRRLAVFGWYRLVVGGLLLGLLALQLV